MIFLAVLIVAAAVLVYKRRRRRVRGARVDPYAASEETPMTNLRPRTSILKRPGAGPGVFSSVNDGNTVMGGRGWMRLDNHDESFEYFDPYDATPPRYDSHEVAGSTSGAASGASANAGAGGGGGAMANTGASASTNASAARASSSSGQISMRATGASSGSSGARTNATPGEADATAFRVLGRGQGVKNGTGFRVVGRDQGTRLSSAGQERHESPAKMVLQPITAGREWSPARTAPSPSSSPANSPVASRPPSQPSQPSQPQSRVHSLRQMKSDLHRYDTFGRPRKEEDALMEDEADRTTETGETSTAESGVVVTGMRGRAGVAVTAASSQTSHGKHVAAHAGPGTRVSR